MRRTTGLGWWLDHQERTLVDPGDSNREREVFRPVLTIELPNLYTGSNGHYLPADPHPPLQQNWVG